MQTSGHLVMKCGRAVTATITRIHKAAGSGTASIDAEFSCEISRDPLWRTSSHGPTWRLYQDEDVAVTRCRLLPWKILMRPWQSRDVASVGCH